MLIVDPSFIDKLEAALLENVRDAGIFLAEEIRQRTSTPGPPRSLPGEPPHIDTGLLVGSWESIEQVNRASAQVVAYVGTDVDYAVDLELGRRDLEPRPHITSTLSMNQDAIRDILTRPI